MNPTPDTLSVEIVSPIPPMPLVLADNAFLSTLATVEGQVAALHVTDAASAQVAADLQVRLTGAGKKLDEERVRLIAPYLTLQRKINDAAKAPALRIENAKSALKVALTNYANEEDRKRIAAEKARLAEIARLEAIAEVERVAEQKRLDEIERQAAEARQLQESQKPSAVEDWGDDEPAEAPEPVEPVVPEKTEAAKALEALKYAPVAAPAPKPVGVQFRVTLVPEVTDANALPDHFVDRVPKMQAIRATYCSGWVEGKPVPSCPGVRFTVDKQPVASGRAKF